MEMKFARTTVSGDINITVFAAIPILFYFYLICQLASQCGCVVQRCGGSTHHHG